MKKRLSAVLVTLVLLAAVLCAAGCVFSSTVPERYYSYQTDLTQGAGRQLYERYNGAAVSVEVARYETREFISGSVFAERKTYTGVYVSEDGWLALPAQAFIPAQYGINNFIYTAKVHRYYVKVTYLAQEGGQSVVKEAEKTFYADPNSAQTPVEGNVYYDEFGGVALVKMPVEGRAFVDVSAENCAAPVLGQKLFLFSFLPQLEVSAATGLISRITVSGQDFCMPENDLNWLFDYIPEGQEADYIVQGGFSAHDIGGMAVDEQGRAAGMVFSRLLAADAESQSQNEDVYGYACMADISCISALLQKAQGGGNAQ